jgi:predicted RNase H-like nuclease (RuvC/YqgF family)
LIGIELLVCYAQVTMASYIEKEQKAAALDASVSKAVAAVTRLDDEYEKLNREESNMMAVLERLEREEVSLQKAMQEASESGADRLKMDRKEREDAALARLENALFETDSSDDDEPNKTKEDSAVARLENALFESDSSDDEPNETKEASS